MGPYAGLSGWDQCNYKSPYLREIRVSEKEIRLWKLEAGISVGEM